MKKCINCGIEYEEENARFCTECGGKLQEIIESPRVKFCGQCGSKLDSNARFCGMCGAMISFPTQAENMVHKPGSKAYEPEPATEVLTAQHIYQQGQYGQQQYEQNYNQQSYQGGQPDVNKIKVKKTKEKKRKKVPTSVWVCVALLVCVGVAGLVYLKIRGRVFEFSDYIMELAVCDALGKDVGDTIYESDLDDITTLKIDRSYAACKKDIHRGWDWVATLYFDLDLQDVKYFKNLERLEIENQYGDKIYGLDSIAECQNLKFLTMWYPVYYNYGYEGLSMGTKELEEIVEGCRSLRKLDTKCALPEELEDYIRQVSPAISLVDYGDYDEESAYVYYSIEPETDVSLDDYLSNDPTVLRISDPTDSDWEKIAKCTSLKSLIVSGDFDFSDIKDMKNLRSIAILGRINGVSAENAEVKNLRLVSSMDNLVSVVFDACDIEVDDLDALDGLDNLMYLGFYDDENDIPDNLKCYKKLKCFAYWNSENEAENYIKNMKDLQKLYCRFFETETFEEICELSDLRSFETFNATCEALNLDGLNSLKKLRNIDFYCIGNEGVDWGGVEFLPELYTVCCHGNVSNIDAFENCKNLRRIYMSLDQTILRLEEGEKLSLNLTGVADLPHLSYFDTYIAPNDKLLPSQYKERLSGVTGLKKMDDNGVLVDIFAWKYREDLYSYYIDVYNGIN
jgi:hypothetical protein